MTTSNNQKRNQSNQASQRPDIDIRNFEDVRGIISIAENEGDAIAYRGYAPPPSNSTGPRRLYGHIIKAKSKGDVIGFEQVLEGEPQANRGALDNRPSNNTHAVYRQRASFNSNERPPLTPEMLADFRRMPPDMQEMVKFLWARGPPDSLAAQDASCSGTEQVPEDSR